MRKERAYSSAVPEPLVWSNTAQNRVMNLSKELVAASPFSQVAVAHSNARPVSREMNAATLEASEAGAPDWWVKCREHWRRNPLHLHVDGEPSYQSMHLEREQAEGQAG